MTDEEAHWIEDLRASLGERAVARIVSRAAGMRLYVPGRRIRESVLCRLAGADVARWLSERYGGEYLDVPSQRAQARDTLRRAVIAEPDAPVNELAHRYGVSARRVLQVRAERAQDGGGDLPLFQRSVSSD